MNQPIPINSRLQTPKGLRVHIGLFGRRNVGKSSLINALTNQSISIVSDTPGTTTDPVEKAAELAPVGPVVFVDTAGVDDVGTLGKQRVERSLSVLSWVDVALLITDTDDLGVYEKEILEKAKVTDTPVILVYNKRDKRAATPDFSSNDKSIIAQAVSTSAVTKDGVNDLRDAIVRVVQTNTEPDKPMMNGILHAGDNVILVTPIDTGAPKGRLILPQVQAIREILDSDSTCTIVRENRVAEVLRNTKEKPAFVMTDSQVVMKIHSLVPSDIPLTTFSIQMANCKCDLAEMARGAAVLEFLKPGDKVMICETCSHHPQADDIGRKKIPRWISQKIGGDLDIDVVVGKDFPADLSAYKLIIQCGGCVVTRRHMLSRLHAAKAQGVPMTNYGVAISYLQGVLERALELHPAALQAFREARQQYLRQEKS